MILEKLSLCTAKKADWVEFEIASYRRGYILLRLDFVRHVLVWKDSNRWFNDFVRSFPEEKLQKLRKALIRFVEDCPPETEGNGKPPSWHVRWGSEGCDKAAVELAGEAKNRAWLELSREIEAASQCYLEF